jgi:transcriptional regulator with XRE-family HTH domain
MEVIAMITEDVGHRIKELRTNQGLSQEKLALRAEMDRTYLAGAEQGKRNISLRSLEKIVMALNVSFEVFFKDL